MSEPTTYVALLRGINVGGRRTVPMARLREVAEQLGLDSVQTYIASGNLIFRSTKRAPALTSELQRACAAEFGFEIDLIVVDRAAVTSAIDGNPFPDGDPKQVVVTFLSAPLTAADRAAMQATAAGDERLDFGPRDATWLYVDYAGGLGRSKLATRLHSGRSDIIATTRNIATVGKLAALMRELS